MVVRENLGLRLFPEHRMPFVAFQLTAALLGALSVRLPRWLTLLGVLITLASAVAFHLTWETNGRFQAFRFENPGVFLGAVALVGISVVAPAIVFFAVPFMFGRWLASRRW